MIYAAVLFATADLSRTEAPQSRPCAAWPPGSAWRFPRKKRPAIGAGTVSSIKGLRGADGMLTSVTSVPGKAVWATGQLVNHAPDQQVVLSLVGGSWVVSRGTVRTPGGAVASADPQPIA